MKIKKVDKAIVLKTITIIFVVIFNIFAMWLCTKRSLWYDEIASIGFVNSNNSFTDILKIYMTTEVYNLPLFPILFAIWYRIVPFGQLYLYLFTFLICDVGIYFLYKLAKKISGDLFACISVIFIITSSFFINAIFIQLRCYCMLFLFSVLAIYTYILKKEKETFKNQILYDLSLTGLIYSHYFGMITVAALFLYELYLFIKRREKFSCILHYLVPLALYIPWGTLCLINSKEDISEFWIPKPEFSNINKVFLSFFSWNKEITYIFYMICFTILINTIFNHSKKDISKKYSICNIFIWIISFSILTTFIYSRYINPKGGIFIERYFVNIYIYVILIFIYGVKQNFNFLLKKKKKKINIILLVTTVIFFVHCINLHLFFNFDTAKKQVVSYDTSSNMEEIADNLYELRNEINSNKALLCFFCTTEFKEGIYDYYFIKAGRGEGPKYIQNEALFYDLLNYTTIYIVSDGFVKVPENLVNNMKIYYNCEEINMYILKYTLK